jgi:chemotaxis protein methyltransferase CheR
MRWAGFRQVRRQVCRRIARRIDDLGLDGPDAFRAYLEATPAEWRHLDGLLHVTISRFDRDRGVFAFIGSAVLPDLARSAKRRRAAVEAWSAGCASGEEPYSLVLLWSRCVAGAYPGVDLHVLATDADAAMIGRARAAVYTASSLRELPDEVRRQAFSRTGEMYGLLPVFREQVELRRHDVRDPVPGGPYDIVLCRNVAFTYFDTELQRDVAARLRAAIRPTGALVLGAHERLPADAAGFEPWSGHPCVYRRT